MHLLSWMYPHDYWCCLQILYVLNPSYGQIHSCCTHVYAVISLDSADANTCVWMLCDPTLCMAQGVYYCISNIECMISLWKQIW